MFSMLIKSFQNEIKFLNSNFDIFKGFLILTEFGKLGKFAKFGSKIRIICLICQLRLSFAKTQLTGHEVDVNFKRNVLFRTSRQLWTVLLRNFLNFLHSYHE